MKNTVIKDIKTKEVAKKVLEKLDKFGVEISDTYEYLKKLTDWIDSHWNCFRENTNFCIKDNIFDWSSSLVAKSNYKDFVFITAEKFLELGEDFLEYLVLWEEETDPVRFFGTEKEAINFINAVLKPTNACNIKIIKIAEITEVVFEKVAKFIKM